MHGVVASIAPSAQLPLCHRACIGAVQGGPPGAPLHRENTWLYRAVAKCLGERREVGTPNRNWYEHREPVFHAQAGLALDDEGTRVQNARRAVLAACAGKCAAVVGCRTPHYGACRVAALADSDARGGLIFSNSSGRLRTRRASRRSTQSLRVKRWHRLDAVSTNGAKRSTTDLGVAQIGAARISMLRCISCAACSTVAWTGNTSSAECSAWPGTTSACRSARRLYCAARSRKLRASVRAGRPPGTGPRGTLPGSRPQE